MLSLDCIHQLHTLHEHAVTALMQQCCAFGRWGCWVGDCSNSLYTCAFIHHPCVFSQGQRLAVQGSFLYVLFVWQAACLQRRV